MKNKKFIVLSIISIILCLVLGLMVRKSEEGILFDERIMEYVHNRTTPLGINIMGKITHLGSVYFLAFIGTVILLYMQRRKKKKELILLLLSTLGSYGLNFTLKNIFLRSRPIKYFLIEQGGYSFPSGHSMVSMTFYTAMTFLITRKIHNKKLRTILWILNSLTIFLIGFSRIYLGVHWPTDVVMGFIIGLIFIYASIKALNLAK